MTPARHSIAVLSVLAFLPAGAALAQDRRYLCDGTEITILPTPDGIVMATPAGLFDLSPVPAASGARYERVGDPGTFFWTKGADATVSVAGSQFLPCPEIPPAGEWRVTDIAGLAMQGNMPSVTFGLDFQATGHGSCNRFSGPWSLTVDGLMIGPLATTRMACAPEAMEQERAFLSVLDQVRGFDRAPDGALVLKDAGGAALITAQR